MDPKDLQPGAVVEVLQQIPQRDYVWTTLASGTVVKLHQDKTGSWFAHARDDKLWLDRLTLETEDGEFVELVLDQYSRIKVLRPAPEKASAENADEPA